MNLATETGITDVHAHVITDDYLSYLGERVASSSAAAAALPWLRNHAGFAAPQLVEQMDAAGVERAWVSLPPPGVATDDPERAAADVAWLTSLVRTQADAFPDRLTAIPTVPAGLPELALGVLAASASDAPAVMIHLRSTGLQPDDLAFDPLLERLQSTGTALFVHPGVEPISDLFDLAGLGSAISAPVQSSAVVLRMIIGGSLDRFPRLTIVLPHAGGVLPFLRARLRDQLDGLGRDLDAYFDRIEFDSACFDHGALALARDAFPSTTVRFGSDAPFRGPVSRAVEFFVEPAGVSR